MDIAPPRDISAGAPPPEAGGGLPDQPPRPKQHWEVNDPSVEIVTVAIFGRKYHFKSNRPELVREIAAMIDRLHRQVMVNLPGLPQNLDYAAHVAFSLARDLIKSRREIEDLKALLAGAEEMAQDMSDIIDLSLET
jgi:hypothetical protein